MELITFPLSVFISVDSTIMYRHLSQTKTKQKTWFFLLHPSDSNFLSFSMNPTSKYYLNIHCLYSSPYFSIPTVDTLVPKLPTEIVSLLSFLRLQYPLLCKSQRIYKSQNRLCHFPVLNVSISKLLNIPCKSPCTP